MFRCDSKLSKTRIQIAKFVKLSKELLLTVIYLPLPKISVSQLLKIATMYQAE